VLKDPQYSILPIIMHCGMYVKGEPGKDEHPDLKYRQKKR
jgi:hypothetical protein